MSVSGRSIGSAVTAAASELRTELATALDENEEEILDAEADSASRDALIFMIDVRMPMQVEDFEEEEEKVEDQHRKEKDRTRTSEASHSRSTPMQRALKAIYHLLNMKIVYSSADFVGLILFGVDTDQVKEQRNRKLTKCRAKEAPVSIGTDAVVFSHETAQLVFPLQVPDIHRIMQLEAWINDPHLLLAEYPPLATSGDTHIAVPLENALWCAQDDFLRLPSRWDSKRLWIFTNDPSPSDPADFQKVLSKANDLLQQDISVELYSVCTREQKRRFDSRIFWEPLLLRGADNGRLPPTAQAEREKQEKMIAVVGGLEDDDDFEGEHFEDGRLAAVRLRKGNRNNIFVSHSWTSILEVVRQRAQRRRAVAKVNLEIPHSKISISTNLFILIHQAKKGRMFPVSMDTFSVLQPSTKYIEETTASAVTADVLATSGRKVYDYAGTKVSFSMEEVRKMRVGAEDGQAPQITILGFKHVDYYKPSCYQWSHSVFVFPTDLRISGSFRAFVALWRKMKELEVFAVVRFLPRQNSKLRYGAMFPQDELVDPSDGAQIRPPGMNILPMPFVEEIRSLEDTLHLRTEQEWPPLVEEGDAEFRAARDLVMALSKPYASGQFENPALKRHYVMLRHRALNHPGAPDFPADPSEWTPEMNATLAWKEINRFSGLFRSLAQMGGEAEKERGADEDAVPAKRSAGPAKRPAAGRHGSQLEVLVPAPAPAAKRARGRRTAVMEDEDNEDTAAAAAAVVGDESLSHPTAERLWNDFQQATDAGQLKKKTVAEMREFLSLMGFRTTGKKDTLMLRIVNYFAGSDSS